MARTSKICHSAQCGGTKQLVRIEFGPIGDGTQGRYVATCKACGTEHPPDTDLIVTDAKQWEADLKAANDGRIPLPLPQASKPAAKLAAKPERE